MAKKNWMAALACCALLALGACSSSSDKRTDADVQPEPDAPAAGPVEAVTQALDDAKVAVMAAETALNEAVTASETPAAVSQADDDSAATAQKSPKDKAREALEAADKALDAAVKAADAAVKAAGDDAAALKLANEAKKAVDDYTAKKPLELVTLTVAVWDAEDAVKADGSAENKAALKTAQAALATAAEGLDDGDLKTALTKVADDADVLRKSLAWATGDRLEPGAVSVAVARTITVDRTARTNPKLKIATKGVPYAKGSFVISPDGDGTTAELPVRAFTTRQFMSVQGKDSYGRVGNTSGAIMTSIELTEDGLVMKTGGDVVAYEMQRTFSESADPKSVDDWVAIGADGIKGKGNGSALSGTPVATEQHVKDLEALKTAGTYTSSDAIPEADGTNTLTAAQVTALNAAGEDACWTASGGVTCGNWAHDDLTITFGEPSQAPDGSAAWYWKARVPLGPGQVASKIAALNNRTNKDLGQYELWLSNYAGFYEGNVLQDKDGKKLKDQGSAADDDEHRYLSHAAYGMFQQIDNITPWAKRPEYVRSQAFHAGYDAFSSARGEKTTDLAKPITGTFEGRTMAHALHTKERRPERFESLRGDISLSATIGGANTITGKIDNLEYFNSGGWNKGYEVSDVTLSGGQIAADGSYKGTAAADTEGAKIYTAPGTFEGNFYGPRDKPETAGWWQLSNSSDVDRNEPAFSRIIGSYGAVCTEGCGD